MHVVYMLVMCKGSPYMLSCGAAAKDCGVHNTLPAVHMQQQHRHCKLCASMLLLLLCTCAALLD